MTGSFLRGGRFRDILRTSSSPLNGNAENNGIEAKSLGPPGLHGLRVEAFRQSPTVLPMDGARVGKGKRSLHISAEVTLSLSKGLFCVCPCKECLPGS